MALATGTLLSVYSALHSTVEKLWIIVDKDKCFGGTVSLHLAKLNKDFSQ